MIKVLMIEARNIPRMSEMPIYRHQPRYCLKSPTTGIFIVSRNSTRVGYKSIKHAFLNCMLWITKNESIREAVKTSMCVIIISGFRIRSNTAGGVVGNLEACLRPLGALFTLFSDIGDLSTKNRCQLTTSLTITIPYVTVGDRKKNISRIEMKSIRKIWIPMTIFNISQNYFSCLDSESSDAGGVFSGLVSVIIGSISFSSRGL